MVKVLVEGSSNDYLLPIEAIAIGFSAKVVILSLKVNTKICRERFQEKCSKICHKSGPKNSRLILTQIQAAVGTSRSILRCLIEVYLDDIEVYFDDRKDFKVKYTLIEK